MTDHTHHDEQQQETLNEIIGYYCSQPQAGNQENLVAMLREIQELLGCIPIDVQEDISAALSLKPIVVRQLIKLFPSLTSAPRRHKITVCTGPACSAAGSALLLDALREAIRGLPFTLTVKSCLKQCRTAPNLRIGGDLYESVKPEQIPGILSRYTGQDEK